MTKIFTSPPPLFQKRYTHKKKTKRKRNNGKTVPALHIPHLKVPLPYFPPSPSFSLTPPLSPHANKHRTLDPIFALTIGLGAAAVRIRREEGARVQGGGGEGEGGKGWGDLGRKGLGRGRGFWARGGWGTGGGGEEIPAASPAVRGRGNPRG